MRAAVEVKVIVQAQTALVVTHGFVRQCAQHTVVVVRHHDGYVVQQVGVLQAGRVLGAEVEFVHLAEHDQQARNFLKLRVHFFLHQLVLRIQYVLEQVDVVLKRCFPAEDCAVAFAAHADGVDVFKGAVATQAVAPEARNSFAAVLEIPFVAVFLGCVAVLAVLFTGAAARFVVTGAHNHAVLVGKLCVLQARAVPREHC